MGGARGFRLPADGWTVGLLLCGLAALLWIATQAWSAPVCGLQPVPGAESPETGAPRETGVRYTTAPGPVMPAWLPPLGVVVDKPTGVHRDCPDCDKECCRPGSDKCCCITWDGRCKCKNPTNASKVLHGG